MNLQLAFPIHLTLDQAAARGAAEDDPLTLTITVHTAKRVKGSFSYNAPSDLDYHGYEDLEYDIEPDITLTENQKADVETAIWEYVGSIGL
jgi:hypothetical protein